VLNSSALANAGSGLRISGLHIQISRFIANGNGSSTEAGIHIDGWFITITRSQASSNAGSGIYISGGEYLTIDKSVTIGNGWTTPHATLTDPGIFLANLTGIRPKGKNYSQGNEGPGCQPDYLC
jgi:hypothetical protein